MNSRNVLYIVNNDTTTGIALEVAELISEKHPDFQTVIYYKTSPYPSYQSKQDLIKIDARYSCDVKALVKSYRLIKNIQPSIIHVHHTISAFVFFVMGMLFCPSAKLIKTVHSSHSSLRLSQIIAAFFIYVMADKILCNSEATRNSFSALHKYLFHHKTEVSYNGVDVEKIRKVEDFNSETDRFFRKEHHTLTIGSVGRLIKVKDHKTLINAFAEVQKRSNVNLKLLLIGDGKERKKLEQLAKSSSLQNDIIFTGAIKRSLVYSLLKDIDIFVISSLQEGFCNALVEAMAANKAIVCSDIGVLREVAGDAALFAEPGNPRSFSDNILRLLENEGIFQDMKQNAGRRAEKFTIEACADRYIKHYNTKVWETVKA